jgi:cyclohexa-1,5-dienecarbonyl-CoA hydratase
MPELNHIKLEKQNAVARITLARPKHNVLNIEMMNELNSVLEGLLADGSLKCVVILGEGRSWCAGVDVGEHKPEFVGEMVKTFNRIFELMDKFEVPTIAAVHGACLGGGMELAIACDIIIAAKAALFGQPEIKLGFLPPYAAIRLPELVGVAKAIEICTTGRNYTAKQARKIGLVTQTCKDEDFNEQVEKLVKEIAANSPLIIRLNKQAVKKHVGMNFPAAVESVSDMFLNTLMKTEDTLEGIASFYEKRKPEWKNK